MKKFRVMAEINRSGYSQGDSEGLFDTLSEANNRAHSAWLHLTDKEQKYHWVYVEEIEVELDEYGDLVQTDESVLEINIPEGAFDSEVYVPIKIKADELWEDVDYLNQIERQGYLDIYEDEYPEEFAEYTLEELIKIKTTELNDLEAQLDRISN